MNAIVSVVVVVTVIVVGFVIQSLRAFRRAGVVVLRVCGSLNPVVSVDVARGVPPTPVVYTSLFELM